jgi:hypothetical protein
MTQPTNWRGSTRRHVAAKWLRVPLLMLAIAPAAHAQTWANGRQRPSLREIATVDETGESAWLWGQEDVAGNGLQQFNPDEQAIDARTVYLRVDANRLWWRTYVSAQSQPQNNLSVYLFADADSNTGSGRTAAATEIDPLLTTDPSGGGYEYVVSVRGDGTQARLWTLDPVQSRFVESAPSANPLEAESGTFLDPLRVGTRDHGYVQVALSASLVGISAACQARFYVRTTNQTQALGAGDLDVGDAIACTPLDADDNQVPDIIEPAQHGCVRNDQCPAGGICWKGYCWLPPVCNEDSDCGRNEDCVDGSCVVESGGNCRENRECASAVCENGRCIACTTNAQCGADRICAPDGRCVAEATAGPGAGGASAATEPSIELGEGERVQGGACACRLASTHYGRRAATWFALLTGVALVQRRRRAKELGR